MRAVNGQQKHVLSFGGHWSRQVGAILLIVLPLKLDVVKEKPLCELRKSAVKVSNYWIASLVSTLILPIVLSGLTR